MLDFGSLKTPTHNGDILVEPSGPRLRETIEWNRPLAAKWHFPFGDHDLQELRQSVRSALTPDPAAPCIVTGHQCEFMHPGVWAKHVAAGRAATLTGGNAINLVVDNDAPKKMSFVVPATDSQGISLREVPFASAPVGLAYESLPALNARQRRELADAFRAALGSRFDRSACPHFLAGLEHAESADDFCSQMIAGRRAIDHAHGIHLLEHRVSRVWGGAFLAAILLDAGNFAAQYNAALADYRRENGIRSPNRPIADLRIDGPRVELPLWTYRPGEARRRVFVEIQQDRRILFAEDKPIGTLSVRDLSRTDTADSTIAHALSQPLRPRALTLTLWARLLLADVFIHGIGGAKYDRITDHIIQNHYGLTPPHMVCVSATLHLDLAAPTASPSDLHHARQQLRDARFNPQRYVTDRPGLEELIQVRARHILRSDQLRASQPHDHAIRRQTFLDIRRSNRDILALDPTVQVHLARSLDQLHHALDQQRIANARDYFVGLFPNAGLADLASRIRAAI